MVKAKEIMNANVITIGRDEDICEAVRAMMLNHISGMPVVNEDGSLAGIITEKDVLALLGGLGEQAGRVEDFMTRKVTCFDQDDELDVIAETFRQNPFRRVPILDGDRLVGMVSRRDLIRYINDTILEDQILKDSILEILF